jgi:hypothetical protein
MKKVLFILTTLVTTMSSFNEPTPSEPRSAEDVARHILTAFQHNSSEEYVLLFPTIAEFHELMKQNDQVYGPYSEGARDEFEEDYEDHLRPKVKAAFESAIAEGKRKGIDWKRAQFVRVEVASRTSNAVTIGRISLMFSVDTEEYLLHIDNAFNINGEWKVTQFLTLG